MSLHIDQAVALFNLLVDGHWYANDVPGTPAPTAQSVARIQQELGIQLPKSMIAFAVACPNYALRFASIGDDFSSDGHIIKINAKFHKKSKSGWLAPWAVVINHGPDFNCSCLDTRNEPSAAGEYPIIYWDYEAGRTFIPEPLGETYTDYIESWILGSAQYHLDNKNRSGSVRTSSRDIASMIEAILGQ